MQLLPNGQDVSSLYFGYNPNLPLTYVGIAVFSVLFLALSARVFFSGSRLFLLLLPFTALLQLVGYALRFECANNPTMGLFIAMSIFLLLCANLIAFVNYKTVREVIIFSGVETRYIVIGPKFAKIFYQFSVIASALQGTGAGMQSDADSRVTGSHLSIAGSCVQLVTLIFFQICARYIDLSPDYLYHLHGKSPKKRLFTTLYATTNLLIIRLIYRIASYAVGPGGAIASREWTFYVFDALMLVACLTIHCIFFIGNYLPHANEVIDEEYNVKETSVNSEQINLQGLNNNSYNNTYQPQPQQQEQRPQNSSNQNSEPSTFEKVISVLPVTRVIYRIIQRA